MKIISKSEWFECTDATNAGIFTILSLETLHSPYLRTRLLRIFPNHGCAPDADLPRKDSRNMTVKLRAAKIHVSKVY
jgi:hypothetical protein